MRIQDLDEQERDCFMSWADDMETDIVMSRQGSRLLGKDIREPLPVSSETAEIVRAMMRNGAT